MYNIEERPEIGYLAPDLNLKDFHGDHVKLSNYKGRVNVLLAFYRGESDPYSMRWLSQLNDDYLFFRSLDTEILAVSADSVEKAANTVKQYKIPFKLLSDSQKIVIKQYGVFDDLSECAEASVFIIDRSGTIRYKQVGISAERHPAKR